MKNNKKLNSYQLLQKLSNSNSILASYIAEREQIKQVANSFYVNDLQRYLRKGKKN